MDFNVKFEDVDNVIDAINLGVQRLEDALDKLKQSNSGFQEGGFQGQSADKAVELALRKMQYIMQLMEIYSKMMEQLHKAQMSALQADEMLQERIHGI